MAARILLFISILPVLLLGKYFFNKDKNKEPRKLLTKLFLGGLAAVVFTIVVTLILENIFPFLGGDTEEMNLYELFIYVFFGVALVEEVSKWVFVYKISFNHEEFDELYDIILYSVFVALGFACIENIMYVFAGGITVGIIRALLAVPGHCCDAVFMGYYLGKAKQAQITKNDSSKVKNIVLSIVVPTILHGIYDFCLFVGTWASIAIFAVFIITMYALAIKKVKEYAATEGKLQYRQRFCTNCGAKIEGNFCTECGHKSI